MHTTLTKTHTFSTDGTHTIRAYTIDKAGNASATDTSGYKEETIKVDKTAPPASLSLGTSTATSIPVTAISGTDTSGIAKYIFQYKTSVSGSWTTKEEKTSSNTTYSYTYIGLNEGTTYYLRVIVVDGASNQGKSAGDTETGKSGTTTISNTDPYSVSTNCSSKTTTSMTITARAYDREQTRLTYTLYWNGSYKDQKTGNSGNTVTFNTVTGLQEYTTQTYSWRVTVTDGAGGSAEKTATDRTLCSGTGNTCPGSRISLLKLQRLGN